MTRNWRSHNRDGRRKSAAERQAARDERSHQEQLERLDRILGKGKGAAKERARLKALIKKGEQQKPELEKEPAKGETAQ